MLKFFTTATLLLGLFITAAAVQQARKHIRLGAQQKFDRLSERIQNEIERRMNLPVSMLKGARGVYAASKSVERLEFKSYVDSRELPTEFPGVRGVGFIKRLTRSNLESFIASERADAAPDFQVHGFDAQPTSVDQSALLPNRTPNDSADALSAQRTTSPFEDLYVITQIYPSEPNREAWGLDIGSEPHRRDAAERAVATGEPTITAKIDLDQTGNHHTPFLYLVPVYRNGSKPATKAQRFEALTGLLYAAIVIEDSISGVFEDAERMLDFQIFDGATTSPVQILFDSETRRAPGNTRRSDDRPEEHVYPKIQQIHVGGRIWTILTRTTPNFDTSIEWTAVYISAIGGTALSVLIALVIWALGRSQAKAVKLAEAMTADLALAEQLAIVRASQIEFHAAAMRSNADTLQRTGEMAHVGGWEVDLKSNVLDWTDEVYRIHELPIGSHVSVERAIGFFPDTARRQVTAAIDSAINQGTPWDLELPLVTEKGRKIWVHFRGECILEEGVAVKLRGALQDITIRKEAEITLQRTATHDKLTGLPNRALLADRLQQRLNRYTRSPDRNFAVLFMDFDRFKLTNDTLGHEAGDELLRQIAARLRKCLRQSDSLGLAEDGLTVGRLGGDEFVIILEEISQLQDVTIVAERVLAALALPYQIAGCEVKSTASIGIVTSGLHYTRPDELMRDADIAMYEAKLAGKARYVVFDRAMHERLQVRIQTEADLHKAIGADQLHLVYQPIVSLLTAEVLGVEALLRWQHPTRGLISPAELIPIAEESGLILPIGEWVLRSACTQFMRWKSELGEKAPRNISVNLSRKQLAVGDLPTKVRTILKETAMPPEALHLEVTETTVMKDPAMSIRLLNEIREIGVKISMDDFGTGYSSLAMLHQFPIDILKIDRSFVSNLSRGTQFSSLVCAIVQLAHNLDMEVIAEGIEVSDQVAMLQSIDCEMGQGYLFSRPLTASALVDYQNEHADADARVNTLGASMAGA
jgi:diguanylate cyclase (GGDEF)-like protein